jgi:phosphoribosylformimino-5-aminoimidazole carboxamide ribonucleotide (ProFAR) isomerase
MYVRDPSKYKLISRRVSIWLHFFHLSLRYQAIHVVTFSSEMQKSNNFCTEMCKACLCKRICELLDVRRWQQVITAWKHITPQRVTVTLNTVNIDQWPSEL